MTKNYFVKASRKKATARAVIKQGKGFIRVNGYALEAFASGYKRALIEEPAILAEDDFKKFDYFVTVAGGGVMSQVEVVRSCIAKGLLAATGDKKAIKDKFLSYDRHLIIDDVRQKEPKKELGKGARKKKQHSKR